MGLDGLLYGWISRVLPQAESDNDPGKVRLARYGELITVGAVRKQAALADEGSYFVANNAGTGVATAAAPTAFSDTAPFLSIFNTDSYSNPNYKRIHLDIAKFIVTAAGTAGTGLAIQIKLDNTNRYSSAGTQLFPTSPNMDVPKSASVADVRFLPTNVAVGTSGRTVVGRQDVLVGTTANLVVGLTGIANFGGVEAVGQLSAAGVASCTAFPPVIIGPQQCCVINFLIPAQSAASSWTPEIGWWER